MVPNCTGFCANGTYGRLTRFHVRILATPPRGSLLLVASTELTTLPFLIAGQARTHGMSVMLTSVSSARTTDCSRPMSAFSRVMDSRDGA